MHIYIYIYVHTYIWIEMMISAPGIRIDNHNSEVNDGHYMILCNQHQPAHFSSKVGDRRAVTAAKHMGKMITTDESSRKNG